MHEYEVTLDGILIFVDKVGGGTLGRRYCGDWIVVAMNGPEFVFDNEILNTGMPKTHEEVAEMVLDFASSAIDGED